MSAAEPTRARMIVFSLLTALILLALLELASGALLLALGGTVFTPSAARQERGAVWRHAVARSNLEKAEPDGDAAEAARPAVDPQVDKSSPEVLHPFLGFVRDPSTPGARLPIGELGFHASPPPPGPRQARVTVGIFGGSVAVGLSRSERLRRRLEEADELAGRAVWIRSFALGGYKQPQQLIALNYALALGEELDLVINLDGFNDIALAPIEYRQLGLFPAYPRQWPRRVTAVPSAEAQRLIGEITYLEGGRARRVAWCEDGPLALSPSCHLLWKVLDFRASRRLGELRAALAVTVEANRRYLAYGPRLELEPTGEPGDPLLAYLARLWGRSSMQMHQLSRAQGLRYYHFLQPNQYDPGGKELTAEERRVAWSVNQPWALTVPEAYPLLSRVGEQLAARGVAFHDLRDVFADSRQSIYNDTCCHFGDRGFDLLGDAIADVILADLRRVPEERPAPAPFELPPGGD